MSPSPQPATGAPTGSGSTARIRSSLRTTLRRVAFATPLRQMLAHRYPYLFSPSQLRFMLNAADEALAAEGAFVEIGCAWGGTTVFLNEHLRTTGNGERRYVALDTFGGFVERDIVHEITQRGKSGDARKFDETFRNNSRDAVAATLAANGFEHVELIEGDVVEQDLTAIGPIAFCLIDVDLLLPVRESLKKVWHQLAPGGVIVVDDCAPDHEWDGALQAYGEVVSEHGLPMDLNEGKLGIIRKPVDGS